MKLIALYIGPFLVVRELFKILDFNVLPLIITIGSAMGSYDKLNNHRSAHYRVSKVFFMFVHFTTN